MDAPAHFAWAALVGRFASCDALGDVVSLWPTLDAGAAAGPQWTNVVSRALRRGDAAAVAWAMLLHADVAAVVDAASLQAPGVPGAVVFGAACAAVERAAIDAGCDVRSTVERLIGETDDAFRGRCVYAALRRGNVAFVAAHARGDSLARAFAEARRRGDHRTAAVAAALSHHVAAMAA